MRNKPKPERGARPRIAIAHDYLTQRGGAERVVLALARAFPNAKIHTTLYDPERTFPEFQELDIETSWLNRFPLFRTHHRAALPLLAPASRSMSIDADVVIASSSGWAHGFPTSGAKIVYCYSPARWLYQPETYLGGSAGRIAKLGLRAIGPALRRWDLRAAATADEYLAISTVVQGRIAKTYGLDARVVPAPLSIELENVRPEPVVTERFDGRLEPFVLCVSRLLPYKNVDAVIDAIRMRPHLRLIVVGKGPEGERLRAGAPTNVLMLSGLTDGQMSWLYERADALIAASHEDFGLTPLEAALRGTPSAVLRAGGFMDTMVENETAVFFDLPQPAAIAEALDQLLAREWDPEVLLARAKFFSERRFVEQIREAIAEQIAS